MAHMVGTSRLQPKGRIGLPRELVRSGVCSRLAWVQVLEPGHLRLCPDRPDGHCWPTNTDDRHRIAIGLGIASRLEAEPGELLLFCQHGHDLDLYAAWRLEELLEPPDQTQ